MRFKTAMPFTTDKIFVDTNVLIYAYDVDAGSEQERAAGLVKELWEQGRDVSARKCFRSSTSTLARRLRLHSPEAWRAKLSGPTHLESVLVQPEMESWRAPLASIASIPPGQVVPPKAVASAEGQRERLTEAATGFKKEIMMVVPIHHATNCSPDVDCVRRLVRSA